MYRASLVNLHPHYLFWETALRYHMGHSLFLWLQQHLSLVSMCISGAALSLTANFLFSLSDRVACLWKLTPWMCLWMVMVYCHGLLLVYSCHYFFVGAIVLGPSKRKSEKYSRRGKATKVFFWHNIWSIQEWGGTSGGFGSSINCIELTIEK